MAKRMIRWLPLVLLLALVGGTIAYAQSTTVYNGCVTKTTGVQPFDQRRLGRAGTKRDLWRLCWT